jgi:hypothetical protein
MKIFIHEWTRMNTNEEKKNADDFDVCVVNGISLSFSYACSFVSIRG